ncbi:MAG TPA: LLM class flavin-dependent oxidoreductase [Candidatus Baltobacteraceae bacterium]|jgi:luciferase family oxidoreductase group 1
MKYFSILDLVPIRKGGTPGEALSRTIELAQHAEQWGYHRYWVAEHHNMPGIGSAATSIVIAAVAGATKTMRVGSGGVMLPNHSPLVIAEQFGTLEALYPGRIDLGLGRAPGTDMITSRALRRDLATTSDRFPQDVLELQRFLDDGFPQHGIQAVPGTGANTPIWLLGSSLFSAQLAAELGLPFGFASHFAPDLLFEALQIYRDTFQPSEELEQPCAMPTIPVIVADTDEEARRLLTSSQQSTANLVRGKPGQLPEPVDMSQMEQLLSSEERAAVAHRQMYAAVGSPATVRERIAGFIKRTQADELMITSMIYDQAARLRSFELASEVLKGLKGG